MWIVKTLTRTTSGGALLREIDGLRFLAIASVVLYHLAGYVMAKGDYDGGALYGVMSRGWFGVVLFFAISGFIISLPFARQHLAGARDVELRQYYLRRLTRLEPPYFIFVTLIFLARIAVGGSFADLMPHFLSTLTYTHNLVYGYKSTIAQVAWSLEIEIQFYLLAPLIARVFLMKNRRGWISALILALCAAQPLFDGWRLNVLMFAQVFLTGFLVADIYVSEPGKSSRWYDVGAVVSISVLYLLLGGIERVWWSPGSQGLYDQAWCALCCAALGILMMSALRGPVTRKLLSHPAVYVIGGMCYTTYLYHEYIISAVGPIAMRLRLDAFPAEYLAVVALVVPVVLVSSAVLFVTLEKPFMQRDWISRIRRHSMIRL